MLIDWISTADKLPDAEMTVLIALSDGEVWTGFLEFDGWRYVSGSPVAPCQVTHWMSFPEAPGVAA